MSTSWSRRALLTALVCSSAGGLVACESQAGGDDQVGPTDAAGRPIPSRPADVGLLLAELQQARQLVSSGRDLGPGPQSGLLREVQLAHGQQADVLARLLLAAGRDPGTPSELPEARASATSPLPADTAASSTGTAAQALPRAERVAALVAALSDDATLERLRPLSGASAANLPMLVSLHGERAAAVLLLGGRISWPTLDGPMGARTVGLLAALRPAVYTVEVVAARASGQERGRFESVLASLGGLTRQVTELAGPAAPAAPLGYGLPEPLATPAQRARLVSEALQPLPAAVVVGTAGLTGDPAGINGSVRLLAEVTRLGHPFGLPVTGFPGMTVP